MRFYSIPNQKPFQSPSYHSLPFISKSFISCIVFYLRTDVFAYVLSPSSNLREDWDPGVFIFVSWKLLSHYLLLLKSLDHHHSFLLLLGGIAFSWWRLTLPPPSHALLLTYLGISCHWLFSSLLSSLQGHLIMLKSPLRPAFQSDTYFQLTLDLSSLSIVRLLERVFYACRHHDYSPHSVLNPMWSGFHPHHSSETVPTGDTNDLLVAKSNGYFLNLFSFGLSPNIIDHSSLFQMPSYLELLWHFVSGFPLVS